MRTPILAYHKVQPGFEPGFTAITPAKFAKQIEYLADSGYHTISFSSLVSGDFKNHSRQVILTFDDALECVYDFAFPILKRFSFTATIFVVTKYVGGRNIWDYHVGPFRSRHCSWAQLLRLYDAGWEIGSHTVSHPSLNSLTLSRGWHELRYSRDLLEKKLGSPVRVVSYPFGKHTTEIVKLSRRAGYEAACTLGRNINCAQTDPYRLARRGVYAFEPLWLFKHKVRNSWISRLDDLKQVAITFLAQGTLLLRYFRGR
jgi:peptidoglycan/xylan/chitin deacetylase (PgdA/CDA1 family)